MGDFLKYIKDEESYAYAVFGEFSVLGSARKPVFMGSGYVECAYDAGDAKQEAGSLNISKVYSPLFKSPASSFPYRGNDEGTRQSYDLAAVTTRTVFDSITAEYINRSMYSEVHS